MTDLRCITLTWDPSDCGDIDIALGMNVSVNEAHHILETACDCTGDLCPDGRVSRAGVEIVAPPAEDDE